MKTNLMQINTTAFEEEDFLLLTTLTEKQISDVLTPILDNIRDSDNWYSNDDLVGFLTDAYPNEIIQHYSTNDIDYLSL